MIIMLLSRGYKAPVTEMAEAGMLTVEQSAIFSSFFKTKVSLQRRDFFVFISQFSGSILKRKNNKLSQRLTRQFQEDGSVLEPERLHAASTYRCTATNIGGRGESPRKVSGGVRTLRPGIHMVGCVHARTQNGCPARDQQDKISLRGLQVKEPFKTTCSFRLRHIYTWLEY
jgi:hypothetical protein